ncbi:hypothetical protein [Klebsiella pneumoniae]|uniref:hypothetical protein n=1 Tax=Klebsiella pneumoniae TaxID=573 RepID=UPI002405E7A1|nr:hypothetical protein [Klebsiella pneumoniae]MDG0749213.1 hypothetical protein [Klebsiella pneumoniae]
MSTSPAPVVVDTACSWVRIIYLTDHDIDVLDKQTKRDILAHNKSARTKEGANKQVISSQADSLIKISRIWADFFPANTSNQPI